MMVAAALAVEWGKVLKLDTPVLEIVVRGTLTYLGLFVLMRVVLRREQGAVGITDLLVVVLIADAAQNAMADDYTSVPSGLVLVATIIFWAAALDWLGYHVAWVQRLTQPPPVELVKDGRLLRRNMRRELITEEELWSQLRLAGVSELSEVARACAEPDGRISVLQAKRGSSDQAEAPDPRQF
jgi:uncharacterized membrane protein YcaP (DUF421 family)